MYPFEPRSDWANLHRPALRTRMIDEDVRTFLALHPRGTVCELGCGLASRFDRLDNGLVRWFDLDLPKVIAVRRQFFDDRPRCSMIAASVTDNKWIEQLQHSGGPWCFVSEAVFVYLDPTEVRHVFETINEQFPGAWVLTDTAARRLIDNRVSREAVPQVPSVSGFRWTCDDPRTLESWTPGLCLDRSRSLLDLSPSLRQRLPWRLRISLGLGRLRKRHPARDYRLNRFVCSRRVANTKYEAGAWSQASLV
ncbi:MAG: class I SAM-dependent methyltransferase [Nannocystaceae bacterium]